MHNGKIIAPDTWINVENIVINVTSEADKKPKNDRDYFLDMLPCHSSATWDNNIDDEETIWEFRHYPRS